MSPPNVIVPLLPAENVPKLSMPPVIQLMLPPEAASTVPLASFNITTEASEITPSCSARMWSAFSDWLPPPEMEICEPEPAASTVPA